MKPQIGDIVLLTVTRLGIHGEGVSSLEGFTIFVGGALAGETVRAVMKEVRKNYGRATVLEYLVQSSHRGVPVCPVFGRCGGCQLMHLEYGQQLATKRQRVVDALQRIGKIDAPVLPCVPSPGRLSYRNKIQLPYQDGHLGFYAFNSHDLVRIEQCSLHCFLGEKAFQKVKEALKTYPPQSLRHVLIKTAVHTRQILVILVTRGNEDIEQLAQWIQASMPEIKGVVQNIHDGPENVVLGKVFHTVVGQQSIFDTLCGLQLKVSCGSFFQVNPAQAENLYQKVIEACALTGEETVLDAYCGVGTLSLLLAQKAKQVIGVESVPQAIQDAQENARNNQITSTLFTCALAEEFIGTLSSIDVAVINPPRKGCDPVFLRKLIELNPCRIVYISCDPATLARDLAILEAAQYRTHTVEPFDMFAQTVHVESLALLMRPPSE